MNEEYNIEELSNKGLEQYLEGNYPDSLKYYYRALSSDLNNSVANCNVGIVCKALNDIELAVAFLKRAIRLDDKNIRAINHLAEIYVYNIKDYDIASKYLDYAVEICPNDPEAYNIYGNIALFEKDYEKAELYLKKAIFLDEKYFKNYYDLASVYFEMSRIKEAKEMVEKSLELNKDYQDAMELYEKLKV